MPSRRESGPRSGGWLPFLLTAFLLGSLPALVRAEVRDDEAATHGDEAARYQLVERYRFDQFEVLQFELSVLSQYSFLVFSGNQALLVDPGRDIEIYLETLEKERKELVGVYLTHSHADFVAGHMEARKALDVPIHVAAKGKVAYPHDPIVDGSVISLGAIELHMLETPGHTPDSTCGVIWSQGAPRLVFTGDTLFVGSVGRPDLLEGTMSAAELASMGWDTWHEKLSKLPDEVIVLPAHGAGSLCGAHLRDEPSTTIGKERTSNPFLVLPSRDAYVAAVLDGLPEAPAYFGHNAAMNRVGPELVDWDAELVSVPPSRDLMDPEKHWVADIRDAEAYAAGHIPNSVNIGLRGRLETWTGIMVPWDADLVLSGEGEELPEAVRRLHRVGYQAKVVDLDDWRAAGLPLSSNRRLAPRDLHQARLRGEAPLTVDVRLAKEWASLRIPSVLNLPLNHLSELSGKLDPRQPVVAVCNSAYRSSMALGILERRGFGQAMSLEGGGEAWIEAGFPVLEPAAQGGHSSPAPESPRRAVHLPDRISATDLQRRIQDLPGTFDLVDVRPLAQFADFHLEGSRRVEIPDLLSDPRYLTGVGPLVLVDRDGSVAMMLAGILSQRTKRSIQALHGGLEAYWEASALQLGSPRGNQGERNHALRATPPPRPAASVSGSAMPSSPPPAPVVPSPSPTRKKRRSAGC